MINISYPGGSGGNWLLAMLVFRPIQTDSVNFHDYKTKNNYKIQMIHELDSTKFDYLLSGKSYFNFYLNVVYKFFHNEADIFKQTDYKNYFLTCVNTARYICKYNDLYSQIFFNYDDLITDPDKFYKKLNEFQEVNQLDKTAHEDFLFRQTTYINSCVNVNGVYENFDNMVWVCFVIGQLMNLDIVPNDFIVFEKDNQQKCIQFAIDNYDKCLLNSVHHINSTRYLPNWF